MAVEVVLGDRLQRMLLCVRLLCLLCLCHDRQLKCSSHRSVVILGRLEMEQELRQVQIVLMQFNLELADGSPNVQEDLLKGADVIDELGDQRLSVLLLSKNSV